jgi:hypothetical protein
MDKIYRFVVIAMVIGCFGTRRGWTHLVYPNSVTRLIAPTDGKLAFVRSMAAGAEIVVQAIPWSMIY